MIIFTSGGHHRAAILWLAFEVVWGLCCLFKVEFRWNVFPYGNESHLDLKGRANLIILWPQNHPVCAILCYALSLFSFGSCWLLMKDNGLQMQICPCQTFLNDDGEDSNRLAIQFCFSGWLRSALGLSSCATHMAANWIPLHTGFNIPFYQTLTITWI